MSKERSLPVPHNPDWGMQRAPLLERDSDFNNAYFKYLRNTSESHVHNRNPQEPRALMCMDEGITPPAQSTIRVAGPVPLFTRTKETLLEAVVQGKVVISTIYSHDHCGAMGYNMKALDQEDYNPNIVGKAMARYFQDRIRKALYREQSSSAQENELAYGGHLPITRRPRNKHTGQIIYFDNRINGLDPALIPGLRPGFTISRRIVGEHASYEYATVALDIAFNAQHLGNELDEKHPFYLVGLAQDERDTKKIKGELDDIRRSHLNDKDRMQVKIITV